MKFDYLKRKIIVSVSNDLFTDQRVKKVCQTLHESNYEILLIGRKLKNSKNVERPYRIRRLRLFFNKGILFYAELNLRLFIILILSKVDILHSNDLDTLLANYLVSKIKKKPLIYDSHEFFTGVPELQEKHFKRKVWEIIENFIFPKLDNIITVNESISKIYFSKYKKEIKIIRNISKPIESKIIKSRKELNLPENKKIIIYQGAGINIERGIEELIECMIYLENHILLIIGGGDVFNKSKIKCRNLRLDEKIIFKEKMDYDKLIQYTKNSDLGISIDKPSSLNYINSLPNKLFDYIESEIPILASRITEVEKIIKKFEIGIFINNHDPIHIANQIKIATESNHFIRKWKKNLKLAKKEFSWNNEEKKLLKIYDQIKK